MSKGKKALIISIVAVVFIAAGVLIWFLVPHGKDKKTMYTDAIKQSLGMQIEGESKEEKGKSKEKSIINTLSEVEDAFEEKTVKVTVTGEGDLSQEKAELYIKGEEIYALINTTLGQTESNQIEFLMKDEKAYFTIKEVLKNYYYIDMAKATNLIDIDAIEKIVEKLEDYLIESLTDAVENSKVKKEDTTITINGTEYETTKYSYTFTGNDLYNLVESFIKKVKNDKELNKLIVDTFKELMNNLKESGFDINLDNELIDLDNINMDEIFDSLLEALAPIKGETDLFTHTVYLDDDDEVISMSFTVVVGSGELNIPVSLIINSVEQNGKGFVEVSLSGMGMKVIDLVLEEVDDETVNIKLDYMGEEYITGKIKFSEDEFEFLIKSKDEKIYLAINFEIEDEFEGKGKIEFKFGEDAKKVINIKVEEVEDMPKVDISNSLPYDKMTDEDTQALNKFTEKANTILDSATNSITQFIPTEQFKSMM